MEVDHDMIKKRKPPGPPPGPPPALSDSEDEEYDPEKGMLNKHASQNYTDVWNNSSLPKYYFS